MEIYGYHKIKKEKQMKKIILLTIFITIYVTFPKFCYAAENNIADNQKKYGVDDFISNAQNYTKDINLNDFYKSSISGKFDNNKIFKVIEKSFSQNIKNAVVGFTGVILIVIIGSFLKSICENLGNESISKIAYYVEYILIVTIVMKNFADIISEIKDSIESLSAFSNSLIPLLMTLLIASGNIASSSALEPILLMIVTISSNLVIKVILPLILVSTTISIIANLSKDISITKISKLLDKGSIFALTTILTIVISVAGLEGNLTSSLDGTTKKLGKTVATSVPVVGSILGDAVDTISGYTNIIKKSTGIVGIFVVISICINPIFKVLSFMIIYYIGEAVAEPIADERIVKIFGCMGKTYKVMLAIICTVLISIIIGLGIAIRISN